MPDQPYSPNDNVERNINLMVDGMYLQEAVINAADLPIIATNPKGLIISFNRAAEKLLGFSAEEVVGKHTPILFHDQEEVNQKTALLAEELDLPLRPGFDTFVAKVKLTNQPDRQEWTYIRKDGSQLQVLLSVTVIKDQEDNNIGWVGIAIDISRQKEIQKQLAESERQLQALLSSIDDIVFEVDDQGRFNKVWVKADELLFLPRERIVGRTLSEMFGEEWAKPFEEGLAKVLATGEPFQYEYKSLATHDPRWFFAKYSLIYDHGKPTRRVSVSIQNITRQKRIELSLRESEEKFRLLAENIPGIVYLMNADAPNKIVYVNDEVQRLTGYSKEEFLQGRIHFRDIVHEDDKVYIVNIYQNALEDRFSYHIEYRIKHSSGQWRWMSETGIAVFPNDSPSYLEGFIIDITPRKESEEALRMMADEKARIFNNSLTLTALASFDGYLTKINPAWEKTLGWPSLELLSRNFLDFLHPEDRTRMSDALALMMNGNPVPYIETRVRCKDGTYRWLLWSSSPDVSRKLIYASAIDITHRKRSEEEVLISKRNLEVAAYELQEQNRQLDEFAHIISHNLRAPVNNIKALLNFINDDSSIKDYQLIFEKIRNVTTSISETMNELMETIKIKKNTDIERVEIRFKDILDKIIRLLEGELIESGAIVSYNFNNAPKIYYSKPYIESILQNLISNAIKYRSPDRTPEIIITTDIVPTGIELRVQDNGLGIDMEKFGNKLFGLHKTFHENSEARGVGLFLTKTQIEAMGGIIKAESEVDKGTTFIIQF